MRGTGREIEARVVTRGYRLALVGGEQQGGVRVREQQSGDRVELDVHVPSYHWSIGVNARSVRIELRVPREGAFDIRTRDGSIEATGVKGDIRLSGGDGHINADEFEGDLHAKSGDGHMRSRHRHRLSGERLYNGLHRLNRLSDDSRSTSDGLLKRSCFSSAQETKLTVSQWTAAAAPM
jgi:hypothetical protein